MTFFPRPLFDVAADGGAGGGGAAAGLALGQKAAEGAAGDAAAVAAAAAAAEAAKGKGGAGGGDAAAVAAAAGEAAKAAGNGRIKVPDEFKANKGLAKFFGEDGTFDPLEPLRSYDSLQTAMGRDKILIPKTPEERKAARIAMGALEDGAKFEIKEPVKLDAQGNIDGTSIKYDKDGEKFLRDFGVAQGWDQAQFNDAYATLHKRSIDAYAAYDASCKAQGAECETAIRKELGEAYDGYVAATLNVFTEFADPQFMQYMGDQKLLSDPRMVRVFGNIAKALNGETSIQKTGEGGGRLELRTPEELDAAITKYRTENHAALYKDELHPDRKKAAAELERLYALRYPEKADASDD